MFLKGREFSLRPFFMRAARFARDERVNLSAKRVHSLPEPSERSSEDGFAALRSSNSAESVPVRGYK